LEKRGTFAEKPSPTPPSTQNLFGIHPVKYYSELIKNNSEINSK